MERMETGFLEQETLPELIRRKMEQLRIVKADLSDLLGKARPTIDRLVVKPDQPFLIAIAELFGLNRAAVLQRFLPNGEGGEENWSDLNRWPDLRAKGRILSILPLKYMAKEGMVNPNLRVQDQISQIITELGFGTQQELVNCLQNQSNALFSRYNRTQSRDAYVSLVFQAHALTRNTPLKGAFERERVLQFADRLGKASSLRSVTISYLQEELSKRGVHFLYLPKVTRAGIRGFTMRASDGNPIVGVLRPPAYLDTFYFALAHELHHVVSDFDQIDGEHFSAEDGPGRDLAEMEAAADAFAIEKLMPENVYHRLAAHIDSEEGLRYEAARQGVNLSVFYGMYCLRTNLWKHYNNKRTRMEDWFADEAVPSWNGNLTRPS